MSEQLTRARNIIQKAFNLHIRNNRELDRAIYYQNELNADNGDFYSDEDTIDDSGVLVEADVRVVEAHVQADWQFKDGIKLRITGRPSEAKPFNVFIISHGWMIRDTKYPKLNPADAKYIVKQKKLLEEIEPTFEIENDT